MATTNKGNKGDAALLSSVKARKRDLEKQAAKLRSDIAKLTEALYEIQSKIGLLDQLIAAEGPKKKTATKSPVTAPSPERSPQASGRKPAAVRLQ